MVSRLFLFSKTRKKMRQITYPKALLMALLLAMSWSANAELIYKGQIDIYVGEEKTIYHNQPAYIYMKYWYLRETQSLGWAASNTQENLAAKIISSNSECCTIKGLNDTSGALLVFELHCEGTGYGERYECYWKINVKSIKVTSITLNKSSLTLEERQEETLTAIVKPDNATNKSVTWSSSNNIVATVDNGKVTAKSIGKATITCKANDGSGKKDSCVITVNSPLVAEINATNFPDENFRKYLLSTSYGKDGQLTEQEIKGVTNISVSGSSSEPGMIRNLKGIEFFTELRSLYCNYNQLTALDLTKNTALTYLDCYNNQLSTLDVSKNTALEHLSCYNNQLTTLDVSKNTALTYLDCDNNQLSTLDVSKNTALTTLYCYDNQLTALDVSKNTAIEYLSCSYNQLTALDVSKNTKLERLSCGSNQLTALDVSKNTALTTLTCHTNQLTALDVSKNTALTWVSCGSNKLTALDVSKNTALKDLSCGNNQLTALDVSKNTELTFLTCHNNQIKEAAMDDLIKSLPVNQTGKEYPFTVVRTDREEGNVCTELQVATAKAKGWTPKAWNGSEEVDYEGEVINDINQLTIGSALVVGYSSNRSVDFTSLQDKGVSAWIATGFRNGNVLLSRVYAIPAGEGVYVKAEKAGTYEIPVSTEDPYYMNMFVGVPYGKTVNMYEEYYGEQFLTLSLALSKTTGKPGFFPNTEAKTYGKNKMYLHMPARMLPEYAKARMNDFLLGIEFEEEEATGISDAEHLNDKGQMTNDKRGEVYDLQGRKVNAYGTMHRSAEGRLLPTGRKNAQLPKGMYIMNGKKVVVK